MQKYLPRIICGVLTFFLGVASASLIVGVKHLFRKRTLGLETSTNILQVSSDTPKSATTKLEVEWAEGNELEHNGYTMRRVFTKVILDHPPSLVESSYVEVRRKRQLIETLDGHVIGPMGNSTSFGLVSLFGGSAKQLAVSQDIFRGGSQWIVDLSDQSRIIFDGTDWAVGREREDIQIIDLDNDGVYELALQVTAFYGFSEWIPTGRTPLPAIIFKYDPATQRYLPANPQFQAYMLEWIGDVSTHVSREVDPVNHLAEILPIVLDYVFFGREQDAWTFFDESYKLPDKKKTKRKIEAVIESQPVYRFICRKSTSHQRTYVDPDSRRQCGPTPLSA